MRGEGIIYHRGAEHTEREIERGEGRRRKSEGGSQKAEGRRRKSEGGSQKAEGRRQRAEGRGQRDGNQKPGTASLFLLPQFSVLPTVLWAVAHTVTSDIFLSPSPLCALSSSVVNSPLPCIHQHYSASICVKISPFSRHQ